MQRRHFLHAAAASALAGGLSLNATRTWAAAVELAAGHPTCWSSSCAAPTTPATCWCRRPRSTAECAPQHRHREVPAPASQRRARAGRRLGADALAAVHAVPAHSGRRGGVRAVRRHRRSVAQSLRDPGSRVELGLPLPGEHARRPARRAPDTTQGFLNRLAQELGARLDSDQRVMSFTDRLPMVLQGRRMVTNTSLARTGKPGTDARQAALLQKMYAGTTLERGVSEGLDTQKQVAVEMAAEMQRSQPQRRSRPRASTSRPRASRA